MEQNGFQIESEGKGSQSRMGLLCTVENPGEAGHQEFVSLWSLAAARKKASS